MKNSRNVTLTKQYLKENDLLAIPFDKGIGICLMHKNAYHGKMNAIIKIHSPNFIPPRKNAMHPLLKEEQRVSDILTQLVKMVKLMKNCTIN